MRNMNLSEINMVKTLAGENFPDKDIQVYSDIAAAQIKQVLFPFGNSDNFNIEDYRYAWIRTTASMLLRRGAEDQHSHNENGISVTFSAEGIPEDVLKTLIPFAVVA